MNCATEWPRPACACEVKPTGGGWKWIKDLRNYRFEPYYGWFVGSSIHTYAAEDVKNHRAPVSRPYGPTSYRKILEHLEVETASLLDAPIKAEPNQTIEAPRRRRGPPPKYQWSDLKTEAFRFMDYHGEFSPDDEEWNAQERLVDKLQEFYENKFGAGNMPAKSTLNEKLPSWLNEWRHRRQPKT